MTSRKFKLKDIFTLSEIIKNIGITEEIDSIFSSVADVLKSIDYNSEEFTGLSDEAKDALVKEKSTQLVDKAQEKAISGLINLLLKNLSKCKEPVVALIASLNGCTQEEAENMGLSELKELFKEIFENENLTELFQQAGSMLKK